MPILPLEVIVSVTLFSADYNMKIPLATYEEAVLRPDRDAWLEAMQKELGIMDEKR